MVWVRVSANRCESEEGGDKSLVEHLAKLPSCQVLLIINGRGRGGYLTSLEGKLCRKSVRFLKEGKRRLPGLKRDRRKGKRERRVERMKRREGGKG